jgi:hypothetical protein
MSATMSTVLGQIAQLAGWLPKRETARADVLSGLADVERRVAAGCLSRGDLLSLQAHVGRLTGSPLRTLLNRRIAQLGELHGLGRGLRSHHGSAPGLLAVTNGRRTA